MDMRDWMAASEIVYSLCADPPEAFGRTVPEALHLGVPVIGWDHGGVQETLAAMFPQGAVTPGDRVELLERSRDFLRTAPAGVAEQRLRSARIHGEDHDGLSICPGGKSIMKLLIRRLQSDWASWLAVAFIALLPFGRLSELPLSIFAISLAFLARSADQRARMRAAAAFVVPLFLCYWLPMVLSTFDSFDPQKSVVQSLAALRYLAAALALSVLLAAPSARERVLRWTAWLLLFWAVDAFIQLFFGRDLFGIAMHPDRLNALFVKKYQFFGPTLAMLSPLVLEHARRNWRPLAWATSFALLLGAVMIAGMRAGWLTMALVLATYMLLMLKRENRELRRTVLTIPALALIVSGGQLLRLAAVPGAAGRDARLHRGPGAGPRRFVDGAGADIPRRAEDVPGTPGERRRRARFSGGLHGLRRAGRRAYRKVRRQVGGHARAQCRARSHVRHRHHRACWGWCWRWFSWSDTGREPRPANGRMLFPLHWRCS